MTGEMWEGLRVRIKQYQDDFYVLRLLEALHAMNDHLDISYVVRSH
jgi:hypothetical protein